MKPLYLIILMSLVIVGCEIVEVPDTEVIQESETFQGTEDYLSEDVELHAPPELVFNTGVEGDFEELWRITTTLQSAEDGTYVVDVHLSEGVTLSEAAKQFFDDVTKYECQEWVEE